MRISGTKCLPVLFLLAIFAPPAICQQTSASSQIREVETAYADLADAYFVLRTIDSGLCKVYQGKDRAAWSQIYREKRKEVVAGLTKQTSAGLSSADTRAVSLMRTSVASFSGEEPGDSGSLQPSGHCQDGQRKDIESSKLQAALYACFDEIGNNLQFEGAHLTRVDALGRLATLDDPARRKALFLAFLPLWQSINGQNESESPYRRRIRMAAADAKQGSKIDAAARTLGVQSTDVERWLEQTLDTWRQATGEQPIEPWDYHYINGQADRVLASAIPREAFLPITEHYYKDLGADLKQLRVLYDLDPRPGKAPLAYMDFVTLGRWTNGLWHPTVLRISANYGSGGLSLLNEFVHENGHAVHGAAVRNRPAFMDLGDDLFVEAFADVTSWDTYDPLWQQKYLGHSAPESDSLRSQYSNVMLDAAWALFELQMLQKPEADPNAVWTEITCHYLHIVPHPELSWWAVRVQLVDPGYMVNYGLGALVTADMRQHIRDSIGAFHTGNAQWYPWISVHLLRFGKERETSDLLRDFLGRSVSPQALLNDIHRVSRPSLKATPPSTPKP
jgi:hypothetical protein